MFANTRGMCTFVKPHVTFFFSNLFPAHCGRAAAAAKEPPAPNKSFALSPHVRPWHLVANLKSAELHKTNGANDFSFCSSASAETNAAARGAIVRSLRFAADHFRESSANAFHQTFEAIIRRGEERFAVELFRRWWRHNPHLFPIEVELYDGAEISLRALRESFVENAAANDRLDAFRRDVLRPRLAQMPHKKDFISSALFTRIILVAVRSGDAELVNELVIKEILHEGVLHTLCGGVILSSSTSPSPSGSEEMDEAKLRFNFIHEKFEDWLVLAGALFAVALLERHATALRREPAAFDRTIRSVREEFMTFMRRACRLDCTTAAPAWSQLLFTTILCCHEESGVFHASPARRPLNVAELWQCIHSRLLRQFPNVFHGGNAVTTLLSFAALEETAVSSLGTQHLSFVGKEEALCRWRLECIKSKKTGPDHFSPKVSCEEHNRLPKMSRRLRARFVAAHCSDSNDTHAASLAGKESEGTETEFRPRGPHRRGFGSVQNFAVSQVSLPVFLTAQGVMDSTADALDALSATRHCALDIFRNHTAQLLLSPVKDTRDSQGRGDIAAEALKPSLFLLVRLFSLLAVVGEQVRETGENKNRGNESDGEFALVNCIAEDLLPYCRPSVAATLKKVIVSHLSRSGSAGVRALVTDYRKFLELATESDALERLLFGLLWSGGNDGDTIQSAYSFGSGSAAWQVMAQNRQALKSSDIMLEMALSHLATLAIAIPDDSRRAMSIRHCVCRIVSLRDVDAGDETTDREETEVEALGKELQWNPPASVHVYISLLELLAWALGGESGEVCAGSSVNTDEESEAYSDVYSTANESGRDTAHVKHAVPSLAATVRQWHTVFSRLCEMCTNAVDVEQSTALLSHTLLERTCVVLSHSCPDVDMLIVSLLILLRPQSATESLDLGDLPAVPDEQTDLPFATPRLLSSLSALLVSNGVHGADIETWRRENDAPATVFDGTSSLYQWHCERLGRCASEPLQEGSSLFSSAESLLFLGSIVFDVLLSDPRWHALRRDNYYAAALAPLTEGSALPFGVVFPSRQMASSFPAGVRQRITNIRDTLREMTPDERWQLRRSFSSVCGAETSDIISTYSLFDGDDDDDDDDDDEEEKKEGDLDGWDKDRCVCTHNGEKFSRQCAMR